jgi:endo-1,4-beta-xylanase
MGCRSKLVLKLAAGILPVLFVACSGSGSRLAPKAGSPAAGVSTDGTGPSTAGGAQPDAGIAGGAGAGGAILTGGSAELLSSAGGKTGGAGTTVMAGTPAGGGGGNGGTISSPGGGRTGGTTGGGIASAAGTTALGGSAVAGATRSTVGGASTLSGGTAFTGGTGGSSATGGVTALGGSRSGPPFPARFVGNIDARGTMPTDFYKYWDQLTPSDAGKWLAVQGVSRDAFNWNTLDPIYKYAEDHGILFTENSFIWGYTPQAWVSGVADADMPGVIKNWMKTFCDRYPKTRLANVVTDPPPHTVPKYANAIGGGGNTTWDWIANAFKWAREACPNTILILNDYGNCEYASYAQHIIDIVTAIKKLDAPIDAIGCQGHDASKVALSTFKTNLDKMASATGLPIYITEFDVGTSDDEKQRAQYADYFPMFWDNPNVRGVTVWGYIMGATWINSSGLMSSDGTMRPAMTWLMDFLKR